MEDIQKHCSNCDKTKSISEFNKDKHQKDGHSYTCRICKRETQKKWSLNNPDKVKALNERKKATRDLYYADPDRKLKYRKSYIERTFNIDYSYYEKLESDQNGLCAICKKTQRDTRYNYLCVDHCHNTNKVRGLLCGPCNRALGHLMDDSSIVLNAYNYLLKHKKEITNDN